MLRGRPTPIRRRVAGRLLATAGFAIALGAVAPGTPAADPLPARLEAARDMAGVDPGRARALLAALRGETIAAGALELRLRADEIECRLLGDVDAAAAIRVAEAGLAAAGPSPPGGARLAWLRLRVCRTGVSIDSGDPTADEQELERIIATATGEALQPARALALLQRGVHRSRTGALQSGQEDLLAACGLLRAPDVATDRELCFGHLANHYRRIGDLDEALSQLQRLRAAARARGAAFDDAIYTYGVAQVLDDRGQADQALEAFTEAARLSERSGDRLGVSYAENDIAVALLRQGRAAEALAHSERALQLLQPGVDPKHELVAAAVRAKLLTALDRPVEAAEILAGIEPRVRERRDDLLLVEWLAARADAAGRLGQWRDAFEALAGWREIDRRIQAQRTSDQAARLRLHFNRARDAEDLNALRAVNEQGQRLRQTQAVAIALFVVLLLASLAYALHKFRQARRMHMLASTDELTGLPNRRASLAYAEDRVRRLRREGGSLAVLMIDVDRFKQINDIHGHATGDEVLRHIARVLPAGLRGADLVGRVGGEEFLVVLPQASQAQAVQVAERMREAIAATPASGAASAVPLTVSIGVAQLASAQEPLATLLERADRALYAAKQSGRNAVVPADAAPAASIGR